MATLAERALERAERRTLLARDAYTYLHIVIIAGMLLSAVGDEIVIAGLTVLFRKLATGEGNEPTAS